MATQPGSSSDGLRRSAGNGIEQRDLRLGFVPLTDCAPLVIAKERGFFRRHGLDVTLVREPSWGTVRDNLAAGLLDGAQMLAPMPLAATLGIGAEAVPMVTALCLDLNGNGITVANALYERMRALDPKSIESRPVSARALKRVVELGRTRGDAPLRFGVTFPFSSHNYELRYWVASAGIDPDRDLDIVVAPPCAMVRMLGEGRLDGYCVGEPWNEQAVMLGLGHTVVRTYDLWNNSPEKVLAVTHEWSELHPATHRALVRALVDAACWLDRPENRLEAVHVIAGESYVDAPVEIVGRALLPEPVEPLRFRPDSTVFFRFAATFPWRSHAAWFVSQMLRWGQIEAPFSMEALVNAVYRPDIYREAVRDLGIPLPACDQKAEGAHTEPWVLEDASEPIPMGPDAFFDGRVFDPSDVCGYVEGFEVRAARGAELVMKG